MLKVFLSGSPALSSNLELPISARLASWQARALPVSAASTDMGANCQPTFTRALEVQTQGMVTARPYPLSISIASALLL